MKNVYPRGLCQVQRNGLEVPAAAPAKIRKIFSKVRGDKRKEVTQIDRDIWVAGWDVEVHRDSTAEGKVTYGVILCSDKDSTLRLQYESREYTVEPGSIYVFDARAPHSLRHLAHPVGLIAFLAWDLPFDFTLQGFARRAQRRLRQWATDSTPTNDVKEKVDGA